MTDNQYRILMGAIEQMELELGSIRATVMLTEAKLEVARTVLAGKQVNWKKLDKHAYAAVCIAAEKSDADYRRYYARYKKAKKQREN